MKVFISEKFAINGLITILFLFLIFHILVMTGAVPFQVVMGGRLKNSAQMLQLELIALIINLVMLFIVFVRAGFFKININQKIITTGFWMMFIVFLLNSIGNLLSNSLFEKFAFTPFTIILSLLSFRLALNDEKTGNEN